jgi:hypothetical protein
MVASSHMAVTLQAVTLQQVISPGNEESLCMTERDS